MRLRCLPPVAAPSAPADLFGGLRGLLRPRRALVALTEDLRRTMGVEHVFLMSSGRAALTVILRALARTSSRRQVIVPAYTCFSVAASVVKAGLDLVPCDINPKTLDFDFDELGRLVSTSPPLCVVSAHLFGLPADTGRAREMCGREGALVIEDAAQAFGFRRGDRWLGTDGDVGFFSFGRGKTVSACGGGAIVTSSRELGGKIQEEWQGLEQASTFSALGSLAKAAILSVLVRPEFYWLPARLPFLGIGETHYSTDFTIAKMSGGHAGLLARWKERLTTMNETRTARVASLRALSGTLADAHARPLLRFPLMCASKAERDRLWEAGRRAGLGIVPMYPSALNGVSELGEPLRGRRYPGAQAVAERLLTLPVHPLVSESDVAAVAALTSARGDQER